MKTTTAVDWTTTAYWRAFRDLTRDLALPLTKVERCQRFVSGVRAILPADAVTLLSLQGEELVPVAAHGLAQEALGHRFAIQDHPRFLAICKEQKVVRFPADSPLEDPFDGLLGGDHGFTSTVHACLGMPLRVEGELAGVLALDAIAHDAFDAAPALLFDVLGALGAATLRMADLADALVAAERHQRHIADVLVRQATDAREQEMIGNSPALENLKEEVGLFASSEFPVLITGETGTGKELVVKSLHRQSLRATQPLIYVNCAALPESVVESELFGHEAGSFTGATQRRLGKFQVADGGCLFLDEIGELPLSVQPKLLRVLQSGEIQRVGSDQTHQVSVRVFAATNRDLEKEVEAGRFRSDLWHRLDVCRLLVPPLRNRLGDVAVLAGHFCDQARRQLGLGPIRLHPDAVTALEAYSWPGNVRELENVLSRAALRASARVAKGNLILVQSADLGADLALPMQTLAAKARQPSFPQPPSKVEEGTPLREAVEAYQRHLIEAALARHDGVWAAAARDLGMHRSNLHHLSQRLGLRD